MAYLNPENILFMDVETVPRHATFDDLSDEFKKFWEHKASFIRNPDNLDVATLYERAGIYAEFGKIVCVSTGRLTKTDDKWSITLRSFYGNDERYMLKGLGSELYKLGKIEERQYLCAHNGREFDFPFMCRRMICSNLRIPYVLDPRGKGSRDSRLIDTMELWKFGDYKNFVSLDLLSKLVGVPSSKTPEMDGSRIYEKYYRDNDMNAIVSYCEADVCTLIGVYMKLSGNMDFDLANTPVSQFSAQTSS